MSLWTGGKDTVNELGHKSLPGNDGAFTYIEGGENLFMPDTDDQQLPGKVGLQAIGGGDEAPWSFNSNWIIYS